MGAQVLAAADGVVQSIYKDPNPPHPLTLQLEHRRGRRSYRTVYNNLASISSGIAPGKAVARGQGVGAPRARTQRMGRQTVTYAMIHFQVDDFSNELEYALLDRDGRLRIDYALEGVAAAAPKDLSRAARYQTQ